VLVPVPKLTGTIYFANASEHCFFLCVNVSFAVGPSEQMLLLACFSFFIFASTPRGVPSIFQTAHPQSFIFLADYVWYVILVEGTIIRLNVSLGLKQQETLYRTKKKTESSYLVF